MAIAAAPAAAGAARSAAGRASAGRAAGGRGAAAAGAGAGGRPPSRRGGGAPDLPERGSWRGRAAGATKKGMGSGSVGKWRRVLIAEFVVCVVLLGLSPLAKGSGEMGPARFMKRGTATCALFVILGIVSAFGAGAAKSSAAFGGLVTLVLLVDQREAFGRMATLLNAPDDDEGGADTIGVGPDDSTATDEGPDLVAT